MEWREAVDIVNHRIKSGLFSAFSAGILVYLLLQADPPAWGHVLAFLIWGTIWLFFLLGTAKKEIKQEAENREKKFKVEVEKATRVAVEKLKETKIRELRQYYRLFLRLIDDFTDVLRERLYCTTELNDEIESLIKSNTFKPTKDKLLDLFRSKKYSEEERKCEQVNKLLSSLCENLSSHDLHMSNLDESVKEAHLFFKSTIFEPESDAPGEGVLKRHPKMYKYPPGIDPRTDTICGKKYPRATAVQCWRQEQIITVDDIPGEAEKHAKHHHENHCECLWENLWGNQDQHYGSMLCAYIARGRPKTPTRKVLAVLSIDTPQKFFFSRDRHSMSLWAEFIAPYRVYIGLLYEAERLQKNLIGCINSIL